VAALRYLFDSVNSCFLPQTFPAQAVLAFVNRHRQAKGFFGAPARPAEAAGKFRSASGTSKAARDRIT
jgi:hypothetical protein